MIHHSPLPDVEIPDLPLTEYVLAGGAGQPDKSALIDASSGQVMTYSPAVGRTLLDAVAVVAAH